MWKCNHCHKSVDAELIDCWNCGYSQFAQTQGSLTSAVIAEGSGFIVSISTYKPGDVSPIAKRPIRVIQALIDESLQRTP